MSRCKYIEFIEGYEDICHYYDEKVQEKMPERSCSYEECPIQHPELLKNLTLKVEK